MESCTLYLNSSMVPICCFSAHMFMDSAYFLPNLPPIFRVLSCRDTALSDSTRESCSHLLGVGDGHQDLFCRSHLLVGVVVHEPLHHPLELLLGDVLLVVSLAGLQEADQGELIYKQNLLIFKQNLAKFNPGFCFSSFGTVTKCAILR